MILRHCEERSDAAIQGGTDRACRPWTATPQEPLAMTDPVWHIIAAIRNAA